MITPSCRWLFSPSPRLGATSALSPRADPSQAQSIRSNVNDKREASHLPSARAGLWPLTGNLQARGWGVLKTSPGSLLRSPTSTGVRAHSTAGSTRHGHVGGWHPGVSACLPSPAPGPCPTATIRRWHAPISRVKVQALAQAHGGGGVLSFQRACVSTCREISRRAILPTPSLCLSLRLWGTRKFLISPCSWRRQTSNAGNLLLPCTST